jgi:recombination associated protein RdgC
MMVYRIAPEWSVPLEQLEDALDKGRFAECGATQLQSMGWLPPRGTAHGPLAESVGGHWILKLMIEKKVVPGSVVKRALEQRVKAIEQETGRKPGKKQSKEIKEELMLDLLPQAFTKQETVLVWIDPKKLVLVTNAGSQAKSDVVTTALVEALPGLVLTLLQTTESASACMSAWLSDGEPPAGFSVDRECELKAPDESKATVRYARHQLDIEEVRSHIAAGKQPTRLAMTWDNRVSFMLTDAMQLKKVSFLDVVFEGQGHKDDAFDADAAIATGELSRLLPDLVDALGGELVKA